MGVARSPPVVQFSNGRCHVEIVLSMVAKFAVLVVGGGHPSCHSSYSCLSSMRGPPTSLCSGREMQAAGLVFDSPPKVRPTIAPPPHFPPSLVWKLANRQYAQSNSLLPLLLTLMCSTSSPARSAPCTTSSPPSYREWRLRTRHSASGLRAFGLFRLWGLSY